MQVIWLAALKFLIVRVEKKCSFIVNLILLGMNLPRKLRNDLCDPAPKNWSQNNYSSHNFMDILKVQGYSMCPIKSCV